MRTNYEVHLPSLTTFLAELEIDRLLVYRGIVRLTTECRRKQGEVETFARAAPVDRSIFLVATTIIGDRLVVASQHLLDCTEREVHNYLPPQAPELHQDISQQIASMGLHPRVGKFVHTAG